MLDSASRVGPARAPEAVGAGVGLRAPHYRDFLTGHPATDWLEVHSENYFGDGGWDLHVLEQVRADYPISLHGVGLALGSAAARADTHLSKLKRLVERIDPMFVSEHLSWGFVTERHLNDLLPMPYTEEALSLMCERVDWVQSALKRRVLLENLSTYLEFRESQMNEAEFIAQVSRRTGCGILLDINNIYVNGRNHGFDPMPLLRLLPADAVGEIHLAGHLIDGDCLIDHHGDRVADPVWELYDFALSHFGPVPTLIEWDTDIPSIEVLLNEAASARSRLTRASAPVEHERVLA